MHPRRCRGRASAGAGPLPSVTSYARAARAALPRRAPVRIAIQLSVRLPKFKRAPATLSMRSLASYGAFCLVTGEFFSKKRAPRLSSTESIQPHSYTNTMVTYRSRQN